MKRLITAASVAALMALTSPLSCLRAADAPASADAQWKSITDIVHSMEAPDPPPTSREESMKMISEGLKKYDAATDEFLKDFPQDPRRWQIKLWILETAQVRDAVGLPPKSGLLAMADEILKADDTDARAKAEASAQKVLLSYEDIDDGKITTEAWQKMAEKHLETYPLLEQNSQIKATIDKAQTVAALRTKPLEIKYTAVDGREVDLASLRGKVILVDFWATWCPPCVAEVPHVVEAYKKLHDKGFEIVGISLDEDKDQLNEFTKEHEMTWPQSFEGKGWQGDIPSRFGIHAIPTMWLLNKKGMLVKSEVRGNLEETVAKLLGE